MTADTRKMPIALSSIVSGYRRAVLAEFDVAPERCRRDRLELLADLSARGLASIKSDVSRR